LKRGKEIGLSPVQISKLKAMQLNLNRTQARTEADIKIAKLELQAIWEDEKAEFSMIQAKVDQLKRAERRFCSRPSRANVTRWRC
jgi:periplasmic protein CpxP/Spy